ncbi:MAG: hypothetical protein AAGG38_14160 [Planctomycetota bacterium]
MNEHDDYGVILEKLAERARAAGVFASVEVVDGKLKAHAQRVEEPCWYQVGPWEEHDGGYRVWAGLYTPDRWLSGSIEADLVHTGDKYEDLLEEELIDQGLDERHAVEHFRDDEKVFVFRSARPAESAAVLSDAAWVERVYKTLLAYEACFRELGDMTPGEE